MEICIFIGNHMVPSKEKNKRSAPRGVLTEVGDQRFASEHSSGLAGRKACSAGMRCTSFR